MKKGFTLVELLVVVLIIGILAAIALPQYQKAVAKSRATQLILAAKTISDEQNVYFLANGVYASDPEDIGGYSKSGSSLLIAQGITCSLQYSNAENNQRVSCNMSKPQVVLQRYYKNGSLNCCAYSDDNFAGDGVCQQIKESTVWSNGCSAASPCHCY